MNIAVIIDDTILEGGAFQYSLSQALLLEKNKDKNYNFIFFTRIKQNVKILAGYDIKSFYLNWSNLDEFLSQIGRNLLISGIFRKLRISIDNKFDRILRKHSIDLIYFLSPSGLSLATEMLNYIFTVWDLNFLDSMEFPEVYAKREFERRERLYQTAIRKAVGVVTDSPATRKKIIEIYHIDKNRIILLPFLPSNSVGILEEEYLRNYVDIKKKYNIKGDYIYYPAQFWPHKNHLYILEGLKILKEKYKLKINAIFSGSDKGNLKFVLNRAMDLGIDGQIFYIGFVGDRELPYLYKQALALVMPTYFGPTNIPPLEAFTMGCPVLYSDLPELRAQVKDAALLLDLKNPNTMCQGLLKIIDKLPEISALKENGKRKVEAFIEENYLDLLKNLFDDYSLRLKTWK
ncbi:MAG: glycosyltransferase family 1 protein [Candidatus Omnitrophota bacterium]|nr:glycosyltransferase family 1 protein [Candidatus Omnitrophota bacterium]